MNKELKVEIIVFIVTAIIFTGVGIYVETKIIADKVTYSVDITVKDKLDDLYYRYNDNRIK